MIPDQFGALGMFKAMQKKSIKFYPVIGWDFWFCENIFLARNAAKDIATIENDIERLANSKGWFLKYFRIFYTLLEFLKTKKGSILDDTIRRGNSLHKSKARSG